MKKLDINNVKVKFNANPNSSRITFETVNGESVVWVKTSDFEGFVINSEAVDLASTDTSQFEHCYDGFDDIFGFENEWEECADRKLAKCHVKLGDYHDDDEYYDLRSI